MKRVINIIGIVVLCGILIHLSVVFVFLFKELDSKNIVGEYIGTITGATFAFASIWFVIKVPSKFLKFIIVMLDMATILYYYLHELYKVPVEYAAIFLAIYTGLVVYFIGDIIPKEIQYANDTETKDLKEELNKFRIEKEIEKLENDHKLCLRRISESKTDATRSIHEKNLLEIEDKLKKIK